MAIQTNPHASKLQRRLLALIAVLVLAAAIGHFKFSSSSSREVTGKTGDLISMPAAELLSDGLVTWSEDYRKASQEQREALLDRGVALARERRALMLKLIRNDPEAALKAAVPRGLRAQLPQAVIDQLEEPISARAPLDVIHSCFDPDGCGHPHDDLNRATVIDDRQYEVHVYGSRLNDLSIPDTSLHGIAIDGHFAVSDSRVRMLEPGELLPPGTPPLAEGAIAVEANGVITVLDDASALAAFEQELVASEANPVVTADDSGQGTINVTSRPSQSWATGSKKMLVILVDFSDVPGTPINKSKSNTPITDDDIDDMINGSGAVRQFYQDGSFGKTDLLLAPAVAGDSPDVTEVFRMPNTGEYYAVNNYDSLLHSHASAAATAAGYNVSGYDRVCIMFTNLGTSVFPGSLFTFGGRASVGGTKLWMNGYFGFREVAHELGHNWGLRHANLWKVTDGNPASLSGTSQAYGDSYDTMGAAAGSPTKHFNQWEKSLLWWIPDSAVPVASTNGTYRVHRLDHGSADLNLPRALKIVRDSTRDYWIGYRRATTTAALNNGAYVLWGYNSRVESNLLDMNTPNADISDAPLAVGASFSDTEAGISFSPVAQGGAGADEWLDIQVSFTPRVSWAATSVSANENGLYAELTVNRAKSSSGAVSINYATSAGSATAPADFTASSGTLSWADGDASPKTIQIPLVADGAVESNEAFTVMLSSPSGCLLDGAASATVTILDGGSGSTTMVPNVVAMTESAAQSAIVAAQLTVGTVSTAYSDTVVAGSVMSQSLAAGLNVLINSPVDLVVSLGVQMVTVPDVVGLPQATAESTLAAAQLSVGDISTAYSESVPAGNVISQSLSAGASVVHDSLVALQVSLGPPNHTPVVSAGTDQTVSLVGPALWTPAQISPVAWYDAADADSIVKSGAYVSCWRDKSGNGHDAVQATAANQPEIGIQTLNSLPLITPRNGAKYMSVTNGPQMRMGMAVVNVRSTAGGSILNVGSTSASTHEFFVRRSSSQLSFDGSGTTTGKYSKDGAAFSGLSKDHAVTSDGSHIWSGVFSSSNTLNFIINRNNLSSGTDGPDVGEILWFGSELNATDRQLVEGYLAHKWGTAGSLVTGHPYKNTRPGRSVVANLDGTVTDEDTPTSNWILVSGPASVSITNASAVDTTVRITTPGTYVFRLTANDGTNAAVSDEVTITVNMPYDTWSGGDFSEVFSTIGLSGNPDGDAFNNLQEFAFGMDPTVPLGRGLSFVSGGSVTQTGSPILMNFAAQGQPAAYRAVFLRRKDRINAGLVYTVQFSADLTQWTKSYLTPTVLTAAGSSGDLEAVSVPYPVSVPANGSTENLPPKFFRVGVEAR